MLKRLLLFMIMAGCSLRASEQSQPQYCPIPLPDPAGFERVQSSSSQSILGHRSPLSSPCESDSAPRLPRLRRSNATVGFASRRLRYRRRRGSGRRTTTRSVSFGSEFGGRGSDDDPARSQRFRV